MDLVLLFPGQGSQKPGMGADLARESPAAAGTFRTVDEALGEPLSTLCFEGPAETLTLTHHAQPALLAHGLAAWACLAPRAATFVRAAAGHSLGEFTAHAAAGTFALADAARLVRRRGMLMYEAGLARPGAMAAVLGDTTRGIDEICAEASALSGGGTVVAANYNSPGQVVISGEVAGVEKAMELCKAAGARRAMRLTVSGAFHSPLMTPARDGLAAALDSTTMSAPRVPIYANVNAEPVRDVASARRLLTEQLTAPVRWIQVVERLAADVPGALFIELGPGNALGGMVRRIAPGLDVMPCGTMAEVQAVLARILS